MPTCQFCLPWNAPLMMKPERSLTAGSVPLRFDGWLWYHLHVTMHQTPREWAGEIDLYVEQLKKPLDNPHLGVT